MSVCSLGFDSVSVSWEGFAVAEQMADEPIPTRPTRKLTELNERYTKIPDFSPQYEGSFVDHLLALGTEKNYSK